MLKAGRKNLCWICAAWLACGVLHLLLFEIDFANAFVQLFCGAVVLLWAISIRKRVTDRRLRHLLGAIALCLISYLVLQTARYILVSGDLTASRYIWYSYYIPMTALPLLCCAAVLCVHTQEDKGLPRLYMLWVILGVILVLGVLTNDLHFCFKTFPDGVMTDQGHDHNNWLFYAISAFIYGTYLLSLVILVRKGSRSGRRHDYRRTQGRHGV